MGSDGCLASSKEIGIGNTNSKLGGTSTLAESVAKVSDRALLVEWRGEAGIR